MKTLLKASAAAIVAMLAVISVGTAQAGSAVYSFSSPGRGFDTTLTSNAIVNPPNLPQCQIPVTIPGTSAITGSISFDPSSFPKVGQAFNVTSGSGFLYLNQSPSAVVNFAASPDGTTTCNYSIPGIYAATIVGPGSPNYTILQMGSIDSTVNIALGLLPWGDGQTPIALNDDITLFSWNQSNIDLLFFNAPGYDYGQVNGMVDESVTVNVPPMLAIQNDPANNQVIVSWATFAGKNYSLQQLGDLTTTNWVNVQDASAGGISTYTNSTVNQNALFFRMAYTPPPPDSVSLKPTGLVKPASVPAK